ncbi:MAG: NTP transferase domain-containing protein [Alphaproteobacteria bacterium]|nr:NTP transferase domain-containing protein [Alphaproteobacteria bacterium]
MMILPAILAGGGEGKRLAPLSTPARTKPFIPLPDGQSLLEKTLRRVNAEGFLPPILIGRNDDRYALMNHARAASIVPQSILLEASSFNTAFAIACATAYAPPDAMLAFLPADHAIDQPEPWKEAMQDAAKLAQDGDTIALIGMEGVAFSAEYGWMELKGTNIIKFLEKPNKLPESGKFFGKFWSIYRYIRGIFAPISRK